MKARTLSLLLTCLGIVGVGATSVTAVKCSKKADEETEKGKKILAYAPAIGCGIVTGACIAGSHHVSGKEIAGLTAALGYVTANRNKIEKVVKEKFGDKQLSEIKKKAIVEQRKDRAESGGKPLVEDTGFGNIHFVDLFLGREFRCSKERVEWAIKQLNWKYHCGELVTMNTFYHLLGLPTYSRAGERFGWDLNSIPNSYKLDQAIDIVMTLGEDENGNEMYVLDIRTEPCDYWYAG